MRIFLSIFVLAVLPGCDLNTTTIKSEVKSSDGKYVETAFISDAGATSSWSPQVHLRRVGERMERVGNILVGYRSPVRLQVRRGMLSRARCPSEHKFVF